MSSPKRLFAGGALAILTAAIVPLRAGPWEGLAIPEAHAFAGIYAQLPQDQIVSCRPFATAPGVAVPPGTPVGDAAQVEYMLATNQIIRQPFFSQGIWNVLNRSACTVYLRFKAFQIRYPLGHPLRYAGQVSVYDQVVALQPGQGEQLNADESRAPDGSLCAAQVDVGAVDPTKDFFGFEQADPRDGTTGIPLCPVESNNGSCQLSAPDAVAPGQQFQATFLLTNTGTKTWVAGDGLHDHRLMSDDPIDNGTWGAARVGIPHDVSPGQSVQVTATFSAPQSAGPQLFSWQMGEEGVERFGDICRKSITISQTRPQCSDGVDNDGDGLTDPQDPGCHYDLNPLNSVSYQPDFNDEARHNVGQCSDGIDNNGGGLIDAQDPACHTDGDASNPYTYDGRRDEAGSPSSAPSFLSWW